MDWPALMNQPWVLTAAKLFGIAVTALLSFRRKPRRQLAVQGRSVPLATAHADAEVPDLAITYRGQTVPCLWRTTIVLWNGGNRTLRRVDIAPADPLRIQHDGSVLDVRVTNVSRAATALAAEPSPDMTSVLLTFDFLDPGDGAVVDILHTDPSGDGYLCGTVIEGPRSWTNRGRIPLQTIDAAERGGNRLPLVFPIVGLPLGLLYLVGGLFPGAVFRLLELLGLSNFLRLTPGTVGWFNVFSGFFLVLFCGRILSRVKPGPPDRLLEAAIKTTRSSFPVDVAPGHVRPADEGPVLGGPDRPSSDA